MSNKPPPVSLVIITFNSQSVIKNCLNSVLGTYPSLELVVVDNASPDDSVTIVSRIARQNQAFLTLVRNPTNLGFAQAANQAARRARSKYLLFVNPDTVFQPGVLPELVGFMDRQSSPVIAAPLVINGPQKNISAGALFTSTGFLIYLNQPPKDSPYQVLAVSGAVFIVKKKDFLRLGGFDPDFFLYSEDADFCIRAFFQGFRLFILPSLIVHHSSGSASKKLPGEFIVFHAFKNRLALLLKNFPWFVLVVVLPIHLLAITLGAAGFLIIGKSRESRAILKAILWNLAHFPQSLKKRHQIFLQKKSSGPQISKHTRLFPINYLIREALNYLKAW